MLHCFFATLSLERGYYLAGIVAAVAAVIGLIGLFWYVRETRRLRQISNRQAEIAAQQIESLAKPCVLIMEDAGQLRAFQDRNLILKNVGTGPALNIRWRLRTWSSDMATAPALGPTEFIRPALKPPDIDASGGAECTFTSLGGRSYRSTSKYVRVPPANSILLEHTFEQIEAI
jgi:hypothetical protein